MNFMELKPLTEADLETIRPYLSYSKERFNDYTIGSVYMWRHSYQIEFTIIEDTLIVKEEYEPGKFAFLFPVGSNIEKALDAIDGYSLARHELPAFYATAEQDHVLLMAHYCHFHCLSDRGWSDYLYLLSDLRDLPGKKYDSKRHNAHRFWKDNPSAEYHTLEAKDLPLFTEFESAFLAENSGRDISQEEFDLAREMLNKFQIIPAKVGYFTLNGKVIGFTLGEVVGDTVYLHVEKALHAYPGIYQALESRYLQDLPSTVLYVNREEDVNNPGLREAKLQLHPCAILDKVFFEVLSPIDLVNELPRLTGERVYLAPLEEKDYAEFAALSRDFDLNRYWGYNYRYDLPEGVKDDAEYFAADVAKDFHDKNEVSWIIHDLSGQFLGQVVLSNFSSDGGAEVGIRLKKEAQKKGYAFESVSLVLAYANEVLGLRYILYESFLENAPSIALAKKLAFEETYQDRLKRHFKKSYQATPSPSR
jgi:RimJ/RimL family protein N-acetyltransferase